MHIQDLMTSPAITCHPNETLAEAARRLWDHDIGALAVVNDDGKLTGMITDRDICMAAYTQGRTLEDLLVNSAMAKHVFAVGPTATVGEVEQLMATQQVRRVPIIDDSGKPIGMVSLNDLALEAVAPGTAMKHAASKITHTLAAICHPRAQQAA